jgi:DnaJ-class molecular chaperone
MEYRDYYKILGVQRTATADAVKSAYRRLARKYHPDVSKEANAEERFKEVQEAYEVLKDPEKRALRSARGRVEIRSTVPAAAGLGERIRVRRGPRASPRPPGRR